MRAPKPLTAVAIIVLPLLGSGCSAQLGAHGSRRLIPTVTTTEIAHGSVRYVPAAERRVRAYELLSDERGGDYLSEPVSARYASEIDKGLSATTLPAGARIEIDVDAFRWRQREELLVVSCDATWRLSRGGKTVIRNHSARRETHDPGLRSEYFAGALSSMASEAFKEFFDDAEVRALLQ